MAKYNESSVSAAANLTEFLSARYDISSELFMEFVRYYERNVEGEKEPIYQMNEDEFGNYPVRSSSPTFPADTFSYGGLCSVKHKVVEFLFYNSETDTCWSSGPVNLKKARIQSGNVLSSILFKIDDLGRPVDKRLSFWVTVEWTEISRTLYENKLRFK